LTAANATSVNAPYGISEWALTGLTPAPCKDVQPSRVKEAVFSVEGKLMDTKEFESRATPGKKTGVLAIIEGVRFWAREDAINEDKNLIDPAILRPMSRLGGITYGRLLEGIELPRPDWEEFKKEAEPAGLARPRAEGQ
jgi:flavin reductase (DIM6/NTAB) family NADH-FMN oxidoreductase RutF